jgi:ParB family transcriptional regulator, chromosome partitioning protein
MSIEALATAGEYRDLPVAQLQESPTDPRRRFDARGLEELAASIRAHGVLEPLLVRTLEDNRYEVIAGARRLRGSRLAEREFVPSRIVQLSDAEAIEAQAIENLQREEIHPLEEALAYKNMLVLDASRYTVGSIAEHVGKSASYIAQRLRLNDLVESVANAFLEDQIGVGHALEIAKLQPSEQEKAFEAAFKLTWTGAHSTRLLLPVRELAAWIEQNILLELVSVPFDKNDETLIPEAGSCANCSKRTGHNTLLFGEPTKDSCSDGACFNTKLTKFVEQKVAAKPELVQISTSWVGAKNGTILGRGRYVSLELGAKTGTRKQPLSPYQKPCPHMKDAIVAEGTERGQIVRVCAEPNCAVHFADRREPDPEEVVKQREARRKELLQRKLEATVRYRIFAEVLKKISAPLERADLVLILHILVARTNPVRIEALARRYKLPPSQSSTPGKTQAELLRLLRRLDETALSKLLMEWVLLEDVESVSRDEPEYLHQAAKQHRLDVAKLRKTVEQEFAAKQAKEAAKQNKGKEMTAPAAKKATPAKKGTSPNRPRGGTTRNRD